MRFGGDFRVQLLNADLLAAINNSHPEWDSEKKKLGALEYDTGWKKNVVTDLGRRYLTASLFSAPLAIMVARGTAPANVRRTNTQLIYHNQTPSQLRAPDTQTNDLALLLQSRVVQYPVPSQTSAGGNKTIAVSGNTVTLTDTNGSGLFSADMVGNNISISGAVNGANNGTFPITAYLSPTQIQYTNTNPGVNETVALTWTAGCTRIINTVGLVTAVANLSNNQTGNGEIFGILAYTVLSSPVTQTANQVADVSYRTSFSLD